MRYVILDGQEVVGQMEIIKGRESQLREALAGKSLSLAESDTGSKVEIFDECSPENQRPCDLTVALGFAQELAREAGVSSEEVDALEAKGSATEAEAKAAVCAVVGRLPEDFRLEGEAIVEVAWGECGCGCDSDDNGSKSTSLPEW